MCGDHLRALGVTRSADAHSPVLREVYATAGSPAPSTAPAGEFAANSRAISTTPRVVRLETSRPFAARRTPADLPFLCWLLSLRQSPRTQPEDLGPSHLDAERLASHFAIANLAWLLGDAATCFVTFSDRAAEASGFLRSGSGRTAANRAVLWRIRRSAVANSRQKSWEDSAFVNTQSLDSRQQVFGREF